MHKSRLGELTIDCSTADLDEAASFWSEALGCRAVPFEGGFQLKTSPNEVQINLQAVTHSSRVHLDIETDDIEAEVQRLEHLGATRIEKCRRWWVMEAPTGHRFCVCRPARSEFDREANRWD